jgi:hypothetical protein
MTKIVANSSWLTPIDQTLMAEALPNSAVAKSLLQRR